MKSLEILLLPTILPGVTHQLEPLQRAHDARRGPEHAVACVLHLLLQHLNPGPLHQDLPPGFQICFQYHPKAPVDLEAAPSHHSHKKDIQQRSHQNDWLSAPSPNFLLLLYQCIIHPILLYCSIGFFSMLSVTNRAKHCCQDKVSSLPTPQSSTVRPSHIADTIAIQPWAAEASLWQTPDRHSYSSPKQGMERQRGHNYTSRIRVYA